jgi:hypothetical protein
MASSTSTTGTRQSLLPSGASHSLTRWTWGRSATVTATRAVQSPVKEPSKPRTTSSPSATRRLVAAQRSQAPSGSQAPSRLTHWPNLYRRKAFSRILGGRVARSASRCRKSSSAGLATAQAASSSTRQPSGAANSRKKKEGSWPARPWSTRRRITPSSPILGGVLMASSRLRSRLPARAAIASKVSSVTTCSSSTIASDGSHPCRAPGSAGSANRVESVWGSSR